MKGTEKVSETLMCQIAGEKIITLSCCKGLKFYLSVLLKIFISAINLKGENVCNIEKNFGKKVYSVFESIFRVLLFLVRTEPAGSATRKLVN
jgi:hypothetical protein